MNWRKVSSEGYGTSVGPFDIEVWKSTLNGLWNFSIMLEDCNWVEDVPTLEYKTGAATFEEAKANALGALKKICNDTVTQIEEDTNVA